MYTCQLIQGMSNGAEQWCPVKGDDWISEVSLNRGFTVCTYIYLLKLEYCTQTGQHIRTYVHNCVYRTAAHSKKVGFNPYLRIRRHL